MKKEKGKAGLIVSMIILTVLAIPFVGLSYLFYFAWDSPLEGNNYKVAFEKDGKLYELNIQASSFAFESGQGENRLYFNSPTYLKDLIALSYGEYEITKTDNPFFAGTVRAKNDRRYYEQTTKYSSPKDSYQNYKFYDEKRNLIFEYEPGTQSEFVIKLRPTFPAFSKRSYGIGAKRDYVDATKLLKEKLNKSLKIHADETNKLLTIRFEN